jgi:DNA (cytosine-5)-methyltransferase 1
VIIVESGKIRTRLLTAREAARLMGARDSYLLPGRYNESYWAMGDGVAVPVTRRLARHLLYPLAEAASLAGRRADEREADAVLAPGRA